MSKRPWYRCHPGRWQTGIEHALAAEDPRRRNLAWLIIELEGGRQGAQKRFAERVGVTTANLSRWLAGTHEVPEEVLVQIAEATGRSLQDLHKPSHPFGWWDSFTNRPIDPGDPAWRAMWESARAQDPSGRPSVAELFRLHPEMFPPDFDPSS